MLARCACSPSLLCGLANEGAGELLLGDWDEGGAGECANVEGNENDSMALFGEAEFGGGD